MVFRGRVVRGAGLGRTIGVPTANIQVSPRRQFPNGVFEVEVSGRKLRPPRRAVCNIGTRPTVDRSGKRRVEVHIPGFKGSLYGATLEVRLLRKLRGERRFASLSALKRQIRRDIGRIRSTPRAKA